jgi:DNA repair protein RadD
MQLREYQRSAVLEVQAQWLAHRAVCLVAPTGSGKTVMANAIVSLHRSCLFIAHRRELIKQAASKIPDAGVIMPGEPYQPILPVQVASVQTLLARETVRPPAELVVLDECHHYRADDWSLVIEAYPNAKLLGLTATPQRSDGRPLGDMFSALVVASSYSRLIADGHLVRCKVWAPSTGVDGLAQHPLQAWKEYAGGTRTFAFATRVAQCEAFCSEFNAAGIPSAVVEANTPTRDRDDALRRFADGDLRVVWNVAALTEGVDVPQAETVLLARNCGHRGLFMQIAGRVLRPYPGKANARLLDLTGMTLRWGMPDEDTIYSLGGEGVHRSSPDPIRTCPSCGHTTLSREWIPRHGETRPACPACGWLAPEPPKLDVKIWDVKLAEVFAGVNTPDDAKRHEYQRLRALARARGYGVAWVRKEYKKLFNAYPDVSDVTRQEKAIELEKLKNYAAANGYKPGWAAYRYKDTFGTWPR